MEQLLNNNLEEKDKLLNVVNNMQIQTQLELEAEITKNQEISKQVASQKMIINKQLEEIAQLNQLVIQKKKQRRSLYSSPLQTSNKQTTNYTLPTQNDYYQKLYEEECIREEKIFKIWKQLQNQNYQQVKQLQDVIDNHLQDQFQKYEQLIESYCSRIVIQDEQINKYRVAFSIIVKQDNRKQIAELLQLAHSVSVEQLNEYDHEQLIETLIDFSNKRDQLYHLQSQNLSNQQTVSQQEFQALKSEYMSLQVELHQIEEQRAELLVLGQQMNDKINLQQEQITSMNAQIQKLTSLFAKSLQDLEAVQEENELLRKSHNFTTRTSEVYSRLSVSAEDKLLKCLSSVSSTYTSKGRKSIKNKSMVTQLSKSYYSSNNDEDLCNLLDSILNQGFSQKTISQIACLGNQGLKKRLKDILFILYNNSNEIDALFESMNTIFRQQQLEFNLQLVNEGISKNTSRLESNCRICCEWLQMLVEKQSQMPQITVISTTLGELSRVLLKLCQGNDDVIVSHIDKHIEIAKQLNSRKDKQLRDLQFSTCKMIMEIFKKWKQNYIRITSVLYSVSKGLQQGLEINIGDDLHEIECSDLGKVIVKELNKLFQLLI